MFISILGCQNSRRFSLGATWIGVTKAMAMKAREVAESSIPEVSRLLCSFSLFSTREIDMGFPGCDDPVHSVHDASVRGNGSGYVHIK